jgi:menaquinone-dependent protoporphyrinogen oxidase
MMMVRSVLVGYATRYGSTKDVAEVIKETLGEHDLTVDLQPLREVRSLAEYSAVIMGAPLFMFHWHKEALNFLSRHHTHLAERPVAVFVLGPTHVPHDEAEWRDSRRQLDQELAKFPWFKPVAIEIFGGKYDPGQLGFPLKLFAGAEPASDIRDWEAIRAWAQAVRPALLQE